jgi:hypothetical protein
VTCPATPVQSEFVYKTLPIRVSFGSGRLAHLADEAHTSV